MEVGRRSHVKSLSIIYFPVLRVGDASRRIETLDFLKTTLYIYSMLTEFTDKVRVIDGVEDQDFYKIRHIPDVTFFD